MGWTSPTPEEKLAATLFEVKAGDVPGQSGRYGEDFGWLLLSALELPASDWNRIAERLIKLDSSGVPFIDSNDPAWGIEIAKASRLIQRRVEDASALDSALLAGVLEAVETVGGAAPASKKARVVAMLYRASKASGKIDPDMVEEAVKLAAD